jgi:hypothetical protein
MLDQLNDVTIDAALFKLQLLWPNVPTDSLSSPVSARVASGGK